MESHRRALEAVKNGYLEREIAPINGLKMDETSREDSSYERACR